MKPPFTSTVGHRREGDTSKGGRELVLPPFIIGGKRGGNAQCCMQAKEVKGGGGKGFEGAAGTPLSQKGEGKSLKNVLLLSPLALSKEKKEKGKGGLLSSLPLSNRVK